jgi:hypothetical protein
MNRLKTGLATALLLGVIVGGLSTPAYALPTLRFIIDGVVTDCADDAACDTLSALGQQGIVQSSVTVAGVSITTTTGTTKPILAPPHMDIIGLNVQTGAGPHDVLMLFSDTDFLVGTPSFLLSFGGTMSNPAGSTVAAAAYFDNAGVGNNALFCGGAGDNCAANGTFIGALGPFGPGAFSGVTTGGGTFTTPYSLTQAIRLHTTGPGLFSGDFEITPVPEPAGVALLGGALLVTVAALRKKLRRI